MKREHRGLRVISMRLAAATLAVAGCGGGGSGGLDRAAVEQHAQAACRTAAADIRGSGEAPTDRLIARTVQSIERAHKKVVDLDPANSAEKLAEQLEDILGKEQAASEKLRYREPVALDKTPFYGLDTQADLLAGATNSRAVRTCGHLTGPLTERLLAERYAVELKKTLRRNPIPPVPDWIDASDAQALVAGAERHLAVVDARHRNPPHADPPAALQDLADDYSVAFGDLSLVDYAVLDAARSSRPSLAKLRRAAARFPRALARVRRARRALVAAVPPTLREVAPPA